MFRVVESVTYLLIVGLFAVAYQNSFCCAFVYSEEADLKYTKQLGTKGIEQGQFTNPHSLAVDNIGNIYVGDTGNKRIQKFSPNGTFILSCGSVGSNDGQFSGLHDLAVDPEGKFVYSVELKNHRVQKFDSSGSFITKWGYNGAGGRDLMRAPHQIAVNSVGNVYLTDPNGNQILKYYDNGTFIGTIGSAGTDPGKFNGPHGIAIDAKDNFYVTDMKNYRIQVFDNKDSFVRQWGSSGIGAGQLSETVPGIAIDDNNPQQLHKPEDIAVNNQGDIYITDTRNSRLQILHLE